MGWSFDRQKIINTFQKVLNESGCKPKKIWVHKSSEFYNRSIKSWLQDNDIEMYSTHTVIVSCKFVHVHTGTKFLDAGCSD